MITIALLAITHPVVSYLGLISYPMYLYHHLGAAIGRQMMPGSPRWIFMIEVVATVVMGSSPRGLGVG